MTDLCTQNRCQYRCANGSDPGGRLDPALLSYGGQHSVWHGAVKVESERMRADLDSEYQTTE